MRASGTCKSCGRPRPCPDCAQDRAAQAWVEQHHPEARAALPSEASTSRLCGGGLERNDRKPPQDVARQFVRDRQQSLELRHYLEIAEHRLRVLRATHDALSAEIAHAQTVVTVLGMRLQGDGADLAEIAERIGYRSHSTVSELLRRIQFEATSRYAERITAAYPCRCGRAGCVIVGAAGVGRPRAYAAKCGQAVRQRRCRARRRLSVTVSVTGADGAGISGFVGGKVCP